MPLFEKPRDERGYILVLMLIFLSVLMLVVVSASENAVVNRKMQVNAAHAAAVFGRAESGLIQAVLRHEGKVITLPDSSIALQVLETPVKIDACGNQMIDFQSIADDQISRLVLNRRDIFAKVPENKNCASIPLHQVVWWKYDY